MQVGGEEILRPGPAEDKDDGSSAGPLRRCIATRTVQPKDGLLRFVVGPDGVIVADLENRLPGRGLWVTPSREALATVARKNLFAKAARAPVTVPEDLADRLERLLERRCLDLLGLARRAGQAVAGFEKVRGWLASGRAGLLLEASDGAEDGRRKLRALARGLPVIELFAGAQLAAALGRDGVVVHAALAKGRFAERLSTESGRLAGLRRPNEKTLDRR